MRKKAEKWLADCKGRYDLVKGYMDTFTGIENPTEEREERDSAHEAELETLETLIDSLKEYINSLE